MMMLLPVPPSRTSPAPPLPSSRSLPAPPNSRSVPGCPIRCRCRRRRAGVALLEDSDRGCAQPGGVDDVIAGAEVPGLARFCGAGDYFGRAEAGDGGTGSRRAALLIRDPDPIRACSALDAAVLIPPKFWLGSIGGPRSTRTTPTSEREKPCPKPTLFGPPAIGALTSSKPLRLTVSSSLGGGTADPRSHVIVLRVPSLSKSSDSVSKRSDG